jgi:hypothetical protein
MNWERFSCGNGGGKFNGECGFCLDNVEKHIAGLESKLEGALGRALTAESQRDEAMTLLNAACEAAEANWKAKAIEAERGRIAAVDRLDRAVELLRICLDAQTGIWGEINSFVDESAVEKQSPKSAAATIELTRTAPSRPDGYKTSVERCPHGKIGHCEPCRVVEEIIQRPAAAERQTPDCKHPEHFKSYEGAGVWFCNACEQRVGINGELV